MNDSDKLNQNKNGNFWLFAGLLCILLISTMARSIDRPFTGLHSWGEAGGAWKARSYLKYGLDYTKGFCVWAVGNPPQENPHRAMDHPQLGRFLPAVDMLIWGINERAIRIGGIIRMIITLLIFMNILRMLLNQKTAIIGGLLFVLLPLVGYFGTGAAGEMGWEYPLNFLAIWCYLIIIREPEDAPVAKKFHKWSLATSLFLAIQICWCSFFLAAAIGIHYVGRCIHKKQLPQTTLLAILVLAPFLSMALNFLIMTVGFDWNWHKIVELYKWRSLKGEMQDFIWADWFAKLWEFAIINFSLPLLITAIAYLTVGQLYIFAAIGTKKSENAATQRFPQFWLFLMPAIFQLFLLKGSLWKHEFWEAPLIPVIVIAGAMGIVMLSELLSKIKPILGKIALVLLVGVITLSCIKHLNYYHSISHFSPQKVKLFKMLNGLIPSDKALLSFEPFTVKQHSAKGEHFRPEVGWYLDRRVIQARTLDEIQKHALQGKGSYYLVPYHPQLAPLIKQLQQTYKFESIPGDPGGPKKAPMRPYLLFNLNSKAAGR